ncbi:hypothetical protein [Acaryochloris marina]|uniref:hypothetical protein n=1 Tax=Acaryochloris marina TaxID=155978 RepID=UPI00059FCDE9|nr:hypothetical protein [Acaryochloris marina]BDM78070.1 hypothetical protein AM10699_09400 [Acaryochloris marina MBIC10699]
MTLNRFDRAWIQCRLKSLMADGKPLEDAIRIAFVEDGIGMMPLWPAVQSVAQVNAREAKRIVIRAIRHRS